MDQRDVNNLLPRLQRWYAAQCDGDWEHGFGITITTLDNPGWLMKVDLVKTSLEHAPFEAFHQGTDKNGSPQGKEWIHCRVVDGVWQGAGDNTALARILEMFL